MQSVNLSAFHKGMPACISTSQNRTFFKRASISRAAWAAWAALALAGGFGLVALIPPHRMDGPDSSPTHAEKGAHLMLYSPVWPEYAEELLHDSHHSGLWGEAENTVRRDYVQIPANSPCRDASSSGFVYFNPEDREKHAGPRLLWNAVFDGRTSVRSWFDFSVDSGLITHRQMATAYVCNDSLERYVMTHLQPDVALADQNEAMKAAFIKFDQDIMMVASTAISESGRLADAYAKAMNAYSGSCALLSLFNEETRELTIANLGNSRAVLGRRDDKGQWTAIPLSSDHTVQNPAEVLRLQQAHRNEPDMIKEGRLLGNKVTRAFGDSRRKWSHDLQEVAREKCFGPDSPKDLLSPPYVTSEPEVSTVRIAPGKGDFVILATDGFWGQPDFPCILADYPFEFLMWRIN